MTDKYNDLRAAIAAGPTPGPWQVIHVGDKPTHLAIMNKNRVSLLTVTHEGETEFGAIFLNEDAEYIAAASPEAIAGLLAERDALREALIVAREYVADEIAYLRNAFRGHEELGRVPEAEADLARIDAAIGDANAHP